MFRKSPDERLGEWSEFRKHLDISPNPFQELAEFWSTAPLITHNHKIDPYNPKSWPTPWELLYENKYDDFTLAMMIGLTLKLTQKFKDSKVEIRTLVNEGKTQLFNLVYIDDGIVLNYDRNNAVKVEDITVALYLENLVEIKFPR